MSKRILDGVVITNKADKTITVAVEKKMLHKKYKKIITKRKKYLVHDEQNACNVGSKVQIMESRPISKLKKWSVVYI